MLTNLNLGNLINPRVLRNLGRAYMERRRFQLSDNQGNLGPRPTFEFSEYNQIKNSSLYGMQALPSLSPSALALSLSFSFSLSKGPLKRPLKQKQNDRWKVIEQKVAEAVKNNKNKQAVFLSIVKQCKQRNGLCSVVSQWAYIKNIFELYAYNESNKINQYYQKNADFRLINDVFLKKIQSPQIQYYFKATIYWQLSFYKKHFKNDSNKNLNVTNSKCLFSFLQEKLQELVFSEISKADLFSMARLLAALNQNPDLTQHITQRYNQVYEKLKDKFNFYKNRNQTVIVSFKHQKGQENQEYLQGKDKNKILLFKYPKQRYWFLFDALRSSKAKIKIDQDFLYQFMRKPFQSQKEKLENLKIMQMNNSKTIFCQLHIYFKSKPLKKNNLISLILTHIVQNDLLNFEYQSREFIIKLAQYMNYINKELKDQKIIEKQQLKQLRELFAKVLPYYTRNFNHFFKNRQRQSKWMAQMQKFLGCMHFFQAQGMESWLKLFEFLAQPQNIQIHQQSTLLGMALSLTYLTKLNRIRLQISQKAIWRQIWKRQENKQLQEENYDNKNIQNKASDQQIKQMIQKIRAHSLKQHGIKIEIQHKQTQNINSTSGIGQTGLQKKITAFEEGAFDSRKQKSYNQKEDSLIGQCLVKIQDSKIGSLKQIQDSNLSEKNDIRLAQEQKQMQDIKSNGTIRKLFRKLRQSGGKIRKTRKRQSDSQLKSFLASQCISSSPVSLQQNGSSSLNKQPKERKRVYTKRKLIFNWLIDEEIRFQQWIQEKVTKDQGKKLI